MANKRAEQPAAAEAPKENKYRDGRWTTPSKRAKGYAEDRKARVHTYGPKLGKQLTDFETGMRSRKERAVTRLSLFPRSRGARRITEVMRHDGR